MFSTGLGAALVYMNIEKVGKIELTRRLCFYHNQQMHNYISKHYLFIYCIPLHVLTFLCHHQGILHLCLANLHLFLKFKLLIYNSIQLLKYYLFNKICSLYSLVQAVCICGCTYNPLLILLVCRSGVYMPNQHYRT